MTPAAKPRRRYSVSRLNGYSGCGLSYRLGHIDRVPQRTAAWFVQGLAVHDAIDVYEKSLRRMSVSDAQQAFEIAWDRELTKALTKVPDKALWTIGGNKKWDTDVRTRHEKGLEQVAGYIAHNDSESPLQPFEIAPGEPAAEIGFSLEWEFPDVTLEVIGYIDLVLEDRSKPGNPLLVRDLKTGSHVPTSPYQHGTYGVAVERVVGEKPSHGDYWIAKDNKASVPRDLAPFTLDVVGDWYRQLDAGIQAGVFLGNTESCFTCMSKDYCPLVGGKKLPSTPPHGDWS